MSTEPELPVEERIFQLLQHLGIERTHIAARLPRDWTGLAATHPEVFSSLTLVCPMAVDPNILGGFTSRLMVFNGDQGPPAERVRSALEGVPEASVASLRDYPIAAWADVVADRTDDIGSTMMNFLAMIDCPVENMVPPTEMDGEVAGISYHIQGSGPPLLLLPLWLSPSQWEPLVPRLSEQYCTITLRGAELGMVAVLESRGRAGGYLGMVRSLIDAVELHPGESVLEVGCGTGVLDRWLARHTGGENQITGLDINSYLLQEAQGLVRKDGLSG